MATFRSINIQTDAADLARLYSYTSAEPMSAESAREWWTLSEGEIRVTTLALDEHCQAIGYWDVNYEHWKEPGYFYIKVIVAPEERGHRLGSQMCEDALRATRERGATRLTSSVREGDLISLKFAERRGFKIEHHTFVSTLDLAEFDEHRFDELMTYLTSEGFRFFSLAEASVTEENKRKLYESIAPRDWTIPATMELFLISALFQKMFSRPPGFVPILKSSLLIKTVGSG